MKRYMKYLILVICVMTMIGFKNVNAKEVYYTNEKGFSFTQEEYNFFKNVYGKKFVQKYFDQDVYNQYSDIDISTAQVNTKRVSTNGSRQNPMRDNPYYYTPAKSIRISSVTSPVLNRIVQTVEWFGEPTVKSYDDLGAYLEGPTRITTPYTVIYSSLTNSTEEAIKYDTDGFGAVLQVPNGDDVMATQVFYYTGTGTIYGSYQHAASTSSLSIAQMFNIDVTGFGGVFDFYGDAYYIYDGMIGVDIDV